MDRKSTKQAVTGALSPADPESPLDPEAVARRAYALYEARGRTPGNENEDWLEAERQLRAERPAAPAVSAPAPAPPPRRNRRAKPPEAEA